MKKQILIILLIIITIASSNFFNKLVAPIKNIALTNSNIVTINWNTKTVPVNDKLVGTNMYDISISNLSNPKYLARMKELRPKFVRIHNAELTELSKDSEHGLKTLDANGIEIWDRKRIQSLAKNIKSLRQNGYNPKFLFNAPSKLPTTYNPFTNTSKFANEMADLVRIINIENNLGIEYWEITNEIDDNFQGGTDCGNSVSYCDKPFSELIRLYNSAVIAMKKVDPKIKTGGLAYQNLWQNLDNFLDFTIKAGTLDFVSYHAYAGSGNPINNLDSLLKDPKWIVRDLGTMVVNKVKTKSPNKKVEVFHDEYNICYVYTCEFENQNNASSKRMIGQEGAVFDALGYIYAMESGIDSLMTWNEKDMYYGKIDQFHNKRPGGMLLEMMDKLKINRVVPHTTTNSSTNEGSVKTLTFLTAQNKKGVIAINRSNFDQNLTIAVPKNSVVNEYKLDNGFLSSKYSTNSTNNKILNLPNYSVVAILY
jgi:hypothetical protein